MPARPRPRQDDNQKAAELVRKATGVKLPKGEDLLGSEKLKRELRAAKKAAKLKPG